MSPTDFQPLLASNDIAFVEHSLSDSPLNILLPSGTLRPGVHQAPPSPERALGTQRPEMCVQKVIDMEPPPMTPLLKDDE
ncbi:MAG: hypothetical protein NVS3B20_21120 [Polyangiales bacterium]